MPKIDAQEVPVRTGASYPSPYDGPCAKRKCRRLGNAGGLTEVGVNLLELPPGAWSSQRHWHASEDEFVHVLSGAVALIDDTGEQTLHAGDCAAFPKNEANGHHLVNLGEKTATCLEIGSRSADDVCSYPDIDLRHVKRDKVYTHRDGTPYRNRNPQEQQNMAKGTHDYRDDPRNAAIKVSLNGELVPRAEGRCRYSTAVSCSVTASGRGFACTRAAWRLPTCISIGCTRAPKHSTWTSG